MDSTFKNTIGGNSGIVRSTQCGLGGIGVNVVGSRLFLVECGNGERYNIMDRHYLGRR